MREGYTPRRRRTRQRNTSTRTHNNSYYMHALYTIVRTKKVNVFNFQNLHDEKHTHYHSDLLLLSASPVSSTMSAILVFISGRVLVSLIAHTDFRR